MTPEVDCHEVLRKFPEEEFSLMKRLLEDDGYFLDEQKGIHLRRVLMGKCAEEIERLLRQRGYEGGELVCTAKTYPDHGTVYAIYDSAKLDYMQVHRGIDGFVASFK